MLAEVKQASHSLTLRPHPKTDNFYDLVVSLATPPPLSLSLSLSLSPSPSHPEPRPGDLVEYTESQTKQFQSFLVRANRYPSLQLGGAGGCGPEKKIVIVEVSNLMK